MKKTEWTVKGWSLPDYNMIHIILQNSEGKKKARPTSRWGALKNG